MTHDHRAGNRDACRRGLAQGPDLGVVAGGLTYAPRVSTSCFIRYLVMCSCALDWTTSSVSMKCTAGSSWSALRK